MAKITVPIQVNLPDDWIDQIIERLRNDPEAEWVEIIRCKDCKWKHITRLSKFIEDYYYCDYHEHVVKADDFCSDAKRRAE